MRKIIFLSICIFYSCISIGQIESNKWLLSNNNVICFDPEISVLAFPESIIPHREGASIVMDGNEEILFSVTGTAVYDKNWEIINNGDHLTNNELINSAQSPIVLQMPGSETHYYVFYTEDHSDEATEGDLKYSIVNVCDENNELSIAPQHKNVIIEGAFSERIHLVEIDRDNYWLLTTTLFERKLLAYKIDESGISEAPVESHIDDLFDGQIGKISVNNQKTKLAWSSTFTGTSGLSIYDFDLSTGKVSNQVKLHNGEIYGIQWSPSDNYIYFTDIFSGSGIYSYSFQTETLNLLYSRSGHYQVGDLRMSPFGDRIIVAQSYNNKLGEIIDTESGGEYKEIDLTFSGELEMRLGLQQQVINYGFDFPEITFTAEDLLINEGEDFTQLTLSDLYTNVMWSDGQLGNSATFYQGGQFYVMAEYNCQSIRTDFEVIKESVFEQDCDSDFDGSNIDEGLLLKVDFTDPILDASMNEITILNTSVGVENDRFEEISAGEFGEGRFLNLGDHDVLKPNFPMSFSFWVYPEELGLNRNYIYTSDLQLDKRAGFAIQTASEDHKIRIFYSDNNGCYNPSCRRGKIAEEGLTLDKWTHVSIVARSFDDIEIYYDGCIVPSLNDGFGEKEMSYSDFPSYVGFADNSNQSNSQRAYWGGKIDDFYFWNRAISEEEILFLYDRFDVPELELEDVYTILDGEDNVSIVLSDEYSEITWSDGQIGNTANFSEAGTYEVEAFYNCHIVCAEFDVEVEIVVPPSDSCQFTQTFDSHCGTSQYRCVLSSPQGFDKYYLEGQVVLPPGFSICETDLNEAVSSSQELYIFEFVQSGQVIDFRAFATIMNIDEFYLEGLVIDIAVCGEEEHACISYILPYGTCQKDYDCTIDYVGVAHGDQNTVNINYCMVLHDFEYEGCSSSFSLEAYLMNASSEKLIFEETFSEDLNHYHCISIPISIEDFLSNDFNCIELRVVDDCSERSCFRYDCNLFNSTDYLTSQEKHGAIEATKSDKTLALKGSDAHITFPFPNPTTSRIWLHTVGDQSSFEIRSYQGVLLEVPIKQNSDLIEIDMSALENGVYFLISIVDGRLNTHKILKIE